MDDQQNVLLRTTTAQEAEQGIGPTAIQRLKRDRPRVHPEKKPAPFLGRAFERVNLSEWN